MSKVICEICGTAYPDTENECPVCGFEKPESAEYAPEEPVAENAAPSRGGRFTKSSVTKKAAVSANPAAKGKSKNKNKKSDKGLIIAIVVLLLAIAVTTGYIYFNYFAPQSKPENTDPVQTTTEPSKETLPPQTEGTTVPEDLSCTSLTLYEQYVTFNKVNTQWLLNVIPTPANTTDEITYSSADQNVATVDADGRITAVGNGETTITVTCGAITVECKVICELIPEETEPEVTEPEETEPEETEPEETKPEETEPEETEPEETKPQDTTDFKLKKTDITFDGKGQTYDLYDGDIDPSKITWTVGKSSVATVKDGVVKAVGPGMTNVYAEYNGVKVSCVIRCDF